MGRAAFIAFFCLGAVGVGLLIGSHAPSNTRSLSLLDYLYPQTIERKGLHYMPLPPNDPDIARSLATHEIYSRLANVDEDLPVHEKTQIPYFWHIHKSGGTN